MFEENVLFKTSAPYRPDDQSSFLSHLANFKTVAHWNDKHNCPISLWIAEGVVKINDESDTGYSCQAKWFLYTEYKDGLGNNLYKQISFNTLESALVFAEYNTSSQTLPGLPFPEGRAAIASSCPPQKF